MSEEIIIDGVNVAECKNLKYDKIKKPICRPICRNGGFAGTYKSCLCKDNSDCYFKQLKRLEQKYNEVLKLAKDNADSNEYCIQELEKENEDLKEINEKNKLKTYTLFKNINNTLEGIEAISFAMWQVALDEADKESDSIVLMSEETCKLIQLHLLKYRHALEEIREIINEQCKQCYTIDGFAKPDDCGICEYKRLLDIINKVLESEEK